MAQRIMNLRQEPVDCTSTGMHTLKSPRIQSIGRATVQMALLLRLRWCLVRASKVGLAFQSATYSALVAVTYPASWIMLASVLRADSYVIGKRPSSSSVGTVAWAEAPVLEDAFSIVFHRLGSLASLSTLTKLKRQGQSWN
jgi:hypothetical protein